MIGVKKKNGNIIPIGYRKKLSGSILNEDNLVKVKKVGGQIFTFPQKEHLVVDLDPICFMQNGKHYSVKSGSFTLWQGGNQKQNLGTITTSTPTGTGFYVNTLEKYWYIGRQAQSNIYWQTDIGANRQFTISLTFKCRGTPSDWRDIWWFNNRDQLRLEYGSGSFYLFGENNLFSTSPQFGAFTLTDYNNLIVVINGRTATGYVNGVESFSETMSRDLLIDLPKIYLAVQRNGQGNLGTDMFIKDLRVWKTNLTPQEVADLQNFVFRS